MESRKSLASVSFVLLVLSIVIVSSNVIEGVEGSCTVQNKSGKKVIILPVQDASVSIEVDVGVSVEVPPSQQHCYLKNGDSGHKIGPVRLPDGVLVVIRDAAISGTVDVYVGVYILGVLRLTVAIVLGL